MAEFEVVMGRVTAHLATVSHHSDTLFNLANQAMAKAPAPIAWVIRGRLDSLNGKLKDFNDLMGRALASCGNPTSLQIKAEAWNSQVANRTSKAWTGTQDNVMHTYDHWTGKAAFAYKAVFSPHWNALSTVRQAANELNKFLNEVAALIFEFWVKVALALISLVVALLGAVMAAGGGAAGAAAGTALAIAALSACAKFVTDLVDVMNGKFQDLRLKRLALDAVKTQPPFSDGRWPTPDRPGYATIANPDNWTLR